MYHRFNEQKYPSTNINLDIFKEQLEIIENEGIKFIHPKILKKAFPKVNNEQKNFIYSR